MTVVGVRRRRARCRRQASWNMRPTCATYSRRSILRAVVGVEVVVAIGKTEPALVEVDGVPVAVLLVLDDARARRARRRPMYCRRATSVASVGRSFTAAMRANSLSSGANPCFAIVSRVHRRVPEVADLLLRSLPRACRFGGRRVLADARAAADRSLPE